MRLDGKLKNVTYNPVSKEYEISFVTLEKPNADELDKLINIEKCSCEIVRATKRRSLDANALMWHCIGKIAEMLKSEKWSIYLQMLKRYGQYTYICVKPNSVNAIKKQWREIEEIGEVDINGQKSIQLLCYYGSSTYDSKEFSKLLDGIKSEMEEMGIESVTSEEIERAVDKWEQLKNGKQ